ncbi:hypothetical protein GGI23_001157 [Coemansia sp. RSA 2559]|nr:hypothetical protein GGI23_001157 [Coemansia sp. RSA 2559]
MQLSRTFILATLSTLVSSSAIPIKRDSSDNAAAISEMMSSLSAEFADPEAASYLMSSALGYISSDLPSDQKTIHQSDLKSIVSKYAPEVASAMIADIFSSAKAAISMLSLPADELASVSSAFSLASKSGIAPISSVIVNALNNEATVYQLDDGIGAATGPTEDGISSATASSSPHSNGSSNAEESNSSEKGESNSSEKAESSHTHSGASFTKVASVGAAAVGIVAMLF